MYTQFLDWQVQAVNFWMMDDCSVYTVACLDIDINFRYAAVRVVYLTLQYMVIPLWTQTKVG